VAVLLPLCAPEALARRASSGIDAETEASARELIETVRRRGLDGLRAVAERFGDVDPGAPLFVERDALERALADLPDTTRAVLERTAARIRVFAEAQRACLLPLDLELAGGRAGHRLVPLESVGCYAPGGRYPLPSSVLMTALVAKVAGVERVVVASPRPPPSVLAAAALAGAERVLAVGGAQAIAALALGVEGLPAVDCIAGPGNRFVTAAKRQLFGVVGIDSLAGPSELVIIADSTADPKLVALDLLAQAEHDPDAWPVLIATDAALIDAVRARIDGSLSRAKAEGAGPAGCAEIAARALRAGAAVLVPDLDAAAALSDRLAPEHLALFVRDPESLAARIRHAGALFLGQSSSEVFGDYGLGPNHVLPTGRSPRHRAGLSVFDFLRARTYLELGPSAQLERPEARRALRDAADLARLEGLHFHAAAAAARR